MRQEFGAPLARVFSDFDERAFAAASIGQVHRATTLDGDEVVGQGPVSRGRGGGRDRPAQRDAAAAARQAAGPGAGRQGAGRRDARADRRGARLRARGPEPAPDRAADARASVRPRPARPHGPLDPARAGLRVRRGRALRGGAPGRRGAARPLRRDRLPVLLRAALSRPDRARGPASRATTCCAPTAASASSTSGLLRDVDAARVAAERADRAGGPGRGRGRR